MAWVTLSESDNDLAERLSAPELAAVQTKVLAPGQPDPVPNTIKRVVDVVRGYIAGCANNLPLGPQGTIPQKLKDAAYSIIIYRLCTRFPAKMLTTDERKEAYRDAIATLRDVSACRLRVEKPDVADTEVINALRPSFNGRWRKFRDQSGV